jgi:hypothetical protein
MPYLFFLVVALFIGNLEWFVFICCFVNTGSSKMISSISKLNISLNTEENIGMFFRMSAEPMRM